MLTWGPLAGSVHYASEVSTESDRGPRLSNAAVAGVWDLSTQLSVTKRIPIMSVEKKNSEAHRIYPVQDLNWGCSREDEHPKRHRPPWTLR